MIDNLEQILASKDFDAVISALPAWGPPNEIRGKVAVVTGASQGIGEACTKAILGAGGRVIAVGRNLEKLQHVYGAYGDAVIPMVADLLKEEDRNTLVEKILTKTPSIDIYCAVAGAYISGSPADNDIKKINDVLTLNGHGVIVPVSAVLKHMRERGTGDVVVVGSIAGRRSPTYEPIYGPVKKMVEEFMDLSRTHFGRKDPEGRRDNDIRLFSISPGPTLTPLIFDWDQTRLKQELEINAVMPAGEVGDAMMYQLTRPRNTEISNMTITPRAFVAI